MLCDGHVSKQEKQGESRKAHTKLRRQFPINRGARPVIRPGNVTILTQRDHWLDREGHARFTLPDRLVLGVMRDIRRAVEDGVDAVSDIGPDHTAVFRLSMLFNSVAKLAEERAGLDQLDGFCETLARCLDHAHGVWVRARPVANVVGLVQVAVVAIVVQSHIQVDDVPVQQHALVWNAVANHFIDGGADGLREVVVVQGRRVRLDRVSEPFRGSSTHLTYISFYARIVHNHIDLVRSDTRPQRSRSEIQDLSGQPAHLAHLFLRLRIKDIDLGSAQHAATGLRYAVGRIVRVRYGLGNLALLRQRIDCANAAGVGEAREGIVRAGFWIRLRYDFRREDGGEHTVLLLVHRFVRGLSRTARSVM
jgi:hypothetical protein